MQRTYLGSATKMACWLLSKHIYELNGDEKQYSKIPLYADLL